MAIDTVLRSAPGATGAPTAAQAARVPARSVDAVGNNSKDAAASAASGSPAPLRSRNAGAAIADALQEQVARAQQALDYLERVAGQLEALKGELSARLSGARSGKQASQQASQQRVQQLDSAVRQLSATLAARQSSAGGGVDANLNFDGQPAQQRFRMRGIDIDSLQQNAPQTVAFSVGGIGGPQLAATITLEQTPEQTARAVDRAVAPLGVRAGLDKGSLVFSAPETAWPAVRDSVAVSGRGRVATDEALPALAPQQWPAGGGNADALRQSLREVVQALERVRHSQNAASNALSNASVQVSAASMPAPDVDIAAEDFAGAAANTNYDSLVALSSALVGVSRERVLALLGLR